MKYSESISTWNLDEFNFINIYLINLKLIIKNIKLIKQLFHWNGFFDGKNDTPKKGRVFFNMKDDTWREFSFTAR